MKMKWNNNWIILFISVVFLLLGVFQFSGMNDTQAHQAGIFGNGIKDSIDNLSLKNAAFAQPTLSTLYYFTGVQNQFTRPIGTAIFCTNIDEDQSTAVEVQIFGDTATMVDTGTYNLAPSETVIFETRPIDSLAEDVQIDIYQTVIYKGSGRILTEHKNVICMVQAVEAELDPDWIMQIPVYGRSGWGTFLPLITN